MILYILLNECIYVLTCFADGKTFLNLNYFYIIMIGVLSAGCYKIFSEHTMKYVEYKMIRDLIAYKENHNYKHNWFIVGKDFLDSQKHARPILENLHTKGYIMDTAKMIDSETHSIEITNAGMYAYDFYKVDTLKRFIVWIAPMIITFILGKIT